MLDFYSFVAPATVKTLVLPMGNIQRGDFEEYYRMLEQTREIRLVDLSPCQGLFNPQGYPHGRILYDHRLRETYSESLFLQDLEPFRRTFVVFGLMKYTPDTTQEQLTQKLEALQREYPNVVSQVLIVFGCSESTQLGTVKGVFRHTGTTLETLVCDVTSYFLKDLSNYAASYQHMTLRSPGEFQTGNASLSLRMNDKEFIHKRSVGSTATQEKTRALRAKGRRNKLMGSFYLLVGRLNDALKEFCDALVAFKSFNDYLWLGSTLEGLAVCIVVLSYLDVPFTLPPQVHAIIAGKDSNLPQLVISPTSSPRTSFQSVHSARGSPAPPTPQGTQYSLNTVPELICKIYQKVILNYRMSFVLPDDFAPSLLYYESLMRYIKFLTLMNVAGELTFSSLRALIRGESLDVDPVVVGASSKTEILSYTQDFFKPDYYKMNIVDQCRIYNSLIAVYTDLGLHRKRSLLCKQLIDMILPKQKTTSVVQSSEGIPELLENVLTTFGVNTDSEKFELSWISLQKMFLFRCMELCEHLGETSSVGKYAFFLLKNFRSVLTDTEQKYAFNAVQNQGMNALNTYWDPSLVENAVPVRDSLTSVPYKRESKVQEAVYNPYSESTEVIPALVEHEVFELTVTFTNRYAFEVSVSDIEFCPKDSNFKLATLLNPKISANGTAETLEGKGMVVVKPASRVTLSIFGIPNSHGLLEIDSLAASVAGCKRKKFQIGLTRSGGDNTKIGFSPDFQFTSKSLKFNVIPPQPLLSLVDVTLNNNWVMLLEGESKFFEIVLQNCSKSSMNELLSTFLDSTVEPLNAALNNKKSLPPNEVYEIEYYLMKRPAYKILNKGSLALIEGLQKFSISMEIIGKRGMKESSICFEYANLDNETEGYLRKLNIPINVTVYPSIELFGCDIYPILYDSPTHGAGDHWEFLRKVQESGGNVTDYCLLALDLKNLWSQKMEVVLGYAGVESIPDERNPEEVEAVEPAFSTKLAISTGRSKRVLIPVKRFDFPTSVLERQIPGLRSKQFILDKKTPQAEQKFIKTAFWYRIQLLRNLAGSWKVMDEVHLSENGKETTRSGKIDLRSIRLSSKMVGILEVEKIEVKLRLLDSAKTLKGHLNLGEFYTMEATIINRSSVPVRGMFRHVPALHSYHLPVAKRILFNGTLQHSVDDIDPGNSKKFIIGFVVLERGEYEWGAIFDEMPLVPEQNTFAKITQHTLRRSLVFSAE